MLAATRLASILCCLHHLLAHTSTRSSIRQAAASSAWGVVGRMPNSDDERQLLEARFETTSNANGSICVLSILRNQTSRWSEPLTAVWQSLAPRLLANKERFCTMCGVRCLIERKRLSGRPASWDRILLLLRAFRMGCEIALWADADAIFLGPLWIEGMARRAPLSFDSGTGSNGLNAGVILARRTHMVDAFLRATWSEKSFTHAVFWEQAAIRYTLRVHPEWRQEVRLFSNLSLPERLPPLFKFRSRPPEVPTPMYHPAGCFSSPENTKRCRPLVLKLLDRADAVLEALPRGGCGQRAGVPNSRAIHERDVQLFINHRRNPDGDRCFTLGPNVKISPFTGSRNLSKAALVREACLNKSEVPGVFLGLRGRSHRYSSGAKG